MIFLHALWVNPGVTADEFDSINPLSAAADFYRRQGWANPFTVMFFDGFDQLDPEYRQNLIRWGYKVVDYSSQCQALYAAYPQLSKLPINEFKCFMRWLAIDDWLKAQGITDQLFVVDADIIFNVDPALVAQDYAGVTSTLQGNCCFTSISNYLWFSQYRTAVNALEANTLEAPTRIVTDMQLIQYLTRSGLLEHTAEAEFIPNLRYYYAENALVLAAHAQAQVGKARGLAFSVPKGVATIEDKPLAFWHFQGGMRSWLNLVFVLRGLGWRGSVPLHQHHRLAWFYTEINNAAGPRKWLQPWVGHLTRRDIIHRIRDFGFAPRSDTLGFDEIYNDKTYWDKGVFL